MTARPIPLEVYVEEPVVLPPRPPPRAVRATPPAEPKVQKKFKKPKVQKKQNVQNNTTKPKFDIIDYDAAKQAGALNALPSHKHTFYVGTRAKDSGDSSKKRVFKIPVEDPQALCAVMVTLSVRHGVCGGDVTIHCEESMKAALSLALKALDMPVTVRPIPGTEKKQTLGRPSSPKAATKSAKAFEPDTCLPASEEDLQGMYKANKVGKLSVQGMKERLEQKWLKGIDCTVRLGGSLKKGVATRDSDVDMIVSVAPEDLDAAEQAVRTNALARGWKTRDFPAMHGREGPLLAWKVNTELGRVDVVVTTPEKYISIETLKEELGWVAGVRQKYPHFKRAVVLLKVWNERNNLKLRGTAVENVVADACEASKGGTLPDVLCTALKRLAEGEQCLNAKYNYENDLADNIKGNAWKDVVAAATAQLQAFEATAIAP
eukprot:TRINITY_DN3187_c0_g1_i1.p1 TRINITY_DN3187_c0_g1~~TRINITY_DN3187_c0_g1_i1.p1  ORF type:complete len:491 (+),score=148.80 TRINITY_DN3187_c0_g1_i1:180-1475(+)